MAIVLELTQDHPSKTGLLLSRAEVAKERGKDDMKNKGQDWQERQGRKLPLLRNIVAGEVDWQEWIDRNGLWSCDLWGWNSEFTLQDFGLFSLQSCQSHWRNLTLASQWRSHIMGQPLQILCTPVYSSLLVFGFLGLCCWKDYFFLFTFNIYFFP